MSEWPMVEVVGIGAGPQPVLTAGLADLSDRAVVEELVTFYRTTLIPQLTCNADGSSPPWPLHNWLEAPGRVAVVVRDEDGVLRGVWCVKENAILFPCATNEYIALIYRALWDETIKHFDYVYGDTANPIIMAFAKKAVRVPPSPNSPTVTDSRLEWRRS